MTGGGRIHSPEGACAPDPALTGKATFGFVYKKGANIPMGNTQFVLHVADLGILLHGVSASSSKVQNQAYSYARAVSKTDITIAR